jgi:hypothetical protein
MHTKIEAETDHTSSMTSGSLKSFAILVPVSYQDGKSLH